MSVAAALPHAHEEGWQAELALGFAERAGVTRLVHRRRRGPLAVQRTFHPEGAPCHAYLLHPPGGVVGGDQLAVDVSVAARAHALLTTPGATKFYRSAGPLAVLGQRLDVAAGGTLEWLPQESILFPGAQVATTIRVALAGDARHCGWEVSCLGRPSCGERFEHGRLDARLAVDRDGVPLLRDRLHVEGARDLDAASGLRGHAATGLFWATPADGAARDAVRAAIEEGDDTAILRGATLCDGLLLVRVMAGDANAARGVLERAWRAWRSTALGIPPCAPRIWAT